MGLRASALRCTATLRAKVLRVIAAALDEKRCGGTLFGLQAVREDQLTTTPVRRLRHRVLGPVMWLY